VREQMLLFLHGCNLACELFPKPIAIDSSNDEEVGDSIMTHSGEFIQDNIYHESASVIKCLRFHYWIRSVLEYIFANKSDGDIDPDELGDMDQDEYIVDGDENNDVAEVDGDVDY